MTHSTQDSDLLEVLLAEVGAVGAHDLEEAGDDLHDSVEVPGAVLPLHDLGYCADVEVAGVGLGIDR